MVEKVEKFDKQDVIQIAIGSFTGALSFLLSGNVADVGEKIPVVNVVFVVFVSVAFAYLSSYFFGIRKLGKKHVRVFFGFVPERIFIQYLLALFSSAFLFYLLGINGPLTPLETIIKRIFVLALPATVFGSAADLIGSKQ